jgi:YD repeat-containing protein
MTNDRVLFMVVLGLAAAAMALGVVACHAQQTTIYGPSGNVAGTITRDSAGTQTFRDASGRTTGTSTRDSAGTQTFRDAQGRTTGTTFTPRR